VSLDANQSSTFQIAKDCLVRTHFLRLIEQYKEFGTFIVGHDGVGTPRSIGNAQCNGIARWGKSAQRSPRLPSMNQVQSGNRVAVSLECVCVCHERKWNKCKCMPPTTTIRASFSRENFRQVICNLRRRDSPSSHEKRQHTRTMFLACVCFSYLCKRDAAVVIGLAICFPFSFRLVVKLGSNGSFTSEVKTLENDPIK
jgi:hypothetical protein